MPVFRCFLAMALLLGSGSAFAKRANVHNPHGSSSGILNDEPTWSVGIAAGNYGGTGVVAQTVGIVGGAVNAELGFADRGLNARADYLLFLGDNWKLTKLQASPGYNGMRGKIMPYFGGGGQVAEGVMLRVPAGVQYGMLKDPFNFFGELSLMLGRFFTEDSFGVNLGVTVGARVLL